MDIQDCRFSLFSQIKNTKDVRQNDKYRELLDQRRANQNLLQAHYGWTTTKVSEDDNLSLVEKLQAHFDSFLCQGWFFHSLCFVKPPRSRVRISYKLCFSAIIWVHVLIIPACLFGEFFFQNSVKKHLFRKSCMNKKSKK